MVGWTHALAVMQGKDIHSIKAQAHALSWLRIEYSIFRLMMVLIAGAENRKDGDLYPKTLKH
jgi:hypothetical protein